MKLTENINKKIQTKFTPLWAHDPDKIPFNADREIPEQIHESIELSFQHLQLDYIDVFFLHAPFPAANSDSDSNSNKEEEEDDDIKAWKVLETYIRDKKIHRLGVSNFSLAQLAKLYDTATFKPAVVQNRFYSATGFDVGVRQFCEEKGMGYQAFGMFPHKHTHNMNMNMNHDSEIMGSDLLASVAEKFAIEKELAFYLLVLALEGGHADSLWHY